MNWVNMTAIVLIKYPSDELEFSFPLMLVLIYSDLKMEMHHLTLNTMPDLTSADANICLQNAIYSSA